VQGVTPTSAPTQPSTVASAEPVNKLCPVSGKPIDVTKFVEFEGKRVAFCCDNCPKTFQADPAKFKDKLK
jgi:YHS domain-containing protein